MGKYIHEIQLNGFNLPSSPATLKSCESLIKKERNIDEQVFQEFPLNVLELASGPYLWIEGSEVLIKNFSDIDNEKLDIPEALVNIEIENFNDNNQLSIVFKNDQDLFAEGIYRFTYEYLDTLFNMGKFSSFCIENGHFDTLLYNIRRLCSVYPDKSLQYRLIKDNNQWYIRGTTSLRYVNYDNHLALYLTLYTLHLHAIETHQWFTLEKAYLSDSEIVVMFDQVRPVNIIGIGKLYFGVILINNEIKEKTFSIELRFRIQDDEGDEFGAIPDGSEPILTIRHDSSINGVKEKLLNLKSLDPFQNRVKNLVMAIAETPYLTEDRIYSIFKKIARSREKFSKETKKSLKTLQQEKIIDNSLHIIKAFNRISELMTDVEERIHLERIFYEVCLDIQKNKK
ncbi:hypothetical protein J7I80_11620 [Bacillus sp. ISL-41]|uniref:hypothetical protein n=1 Tax=Bacillus sp. ISL-41 TaxID=2819127 RepID=UPI001BEC5A87|nr:hypothetical protein [Bacillus sp. ISL-41]MBT2642877.1 hypothetical protein [Bacillus sp. ISL-41]